MKKEMNAERISERELVTSRLIPASLGVVYEKWVLPELFKKWWVLKSAPITLTSCEMNVRTGGNYRLVFEAGDASVEFFGRYLEVQAHSRLVWTNEEGGEEAANITTVTFETVDNSTLIVVHDLYPSKAALDEALEDGSSGAMPEQLKQLEALILE